MFHLDSLPTPQNDFHAQHVKLLVRCYSELTGRELIKGNDDTDRARKLFEAPFFVASHDVSDDPVLTYGNRCALALFEMSWDEFVGTPSRFTAEEPNREERARLLERVTADGYIDDYSGVRISKQGQRFRIHQATVWNLSDNSGTRIGQAATFSSWESL